MLVLDDRADILEKQLIGDEKHPVHVRENSLHKATDKGAIAVDAALTQTLERVDDFGHVLSVAANLELVQKVAALGQRSEWKRQQQVVRQALRAVLDPKNDANVGHHLCNDLLELAVYLDDLIIHQPH